MRESHMKYFLPFFRRQRRSPLLDVQQAEGRNQEFSLLKHDAEARDDSEEPPVVQKIPGTKEVSFKLSQESSE